MKLAHSFLDSSGLVKKNTGISYIRIIERLNYLNLLFFNDIAVLNIHTSLLKRYMGFYLHQNCEYEITVIV